MVININCSEKEWGKNYTNRRLNWRPCGNWFGLLFFSQNWTNSENIRKNSKLSIDFDKFCRFFECHSILAEKRQTKQANYSSLSLFASLDTQDTLHDGMKKVWPEIPVWCYSYSHQQMQLRCITWILRLGSYCLQLRHLK